MSTDGGNRMHSDRRRVVGQRRQSSQAHLVVRPAWRHTQERDVAVERQPDLHELGQQGQRRRRGAHSGRGRRGRKRHGRRWQLRHCSGGRGCRCGGCRCGGFRCGGMSLRRHRARGSLRIAGLWPRNTSGCDEHRRRPPQRSECAEGLSHAAAWWCSSQNRATCYPARLPDVATSTTTTLLGEMHDQLVQVGVVGAAIVGEGIQGPMAKWIRRLTTDQEIPGSTPGRFDSFF